MVSDLAIYQIARLLIDQHGGDGAKLLAVQRADEMLAKGNLEGWQK